LRKGHTKKRTEYYATPDETLELQHEKSLAGVTLAVLCAGAASAADLRPVFKAPPLVIDPWTGAYVGVNIGYSWGSLEREQQPADFRL